LPRRRDARAGAYAAAARTLEPHATVDPAAAALEALLRDAALRRALTPTTAVLERHTDVDRIVVRLVATLPVDRTEHGETIRTVVEAVARSVADDDAALALSRALIGGPAFLGLALAFAPALTRRRVLDVAVCVGPAGLAALAAAFQPTEDLRAAAAALAAAHDADALLAAGLGLFRAARPPTPELSPAPGDGSDSDSDDAEPRRELSREDSIDRFVAEAKRACKFGPSASDDSLPAPAPAPPPAPPPAPVAASPPAPPPTDAPTPPSRTSTPQSRASTPFARLRRSLGAAPPLLPIPPRAVSSPVATPPTPPPRRQRSSSEGELGATAAAFQERGERLDRAGRQADGLAGAAGTFQALAAARRRRAEERRKRWF